MREPFTPEKREFLLQYGAELPTADLTAKLNEQFNSHHSPGSVRTTVKKLGIKKSRECRSYICAQKGEPIGTEKIVNGYRYVKTQVSSGGFYKDWKRKIDIAYEQVYGAIPDGYMVVTLDNNRLNETPENLCAISKSVAARMTNGHGKKMWSEFPEVTRTAIEICKLDEAIKKI